MKEPSRPEETFDSVNAFVKSLQQARQDMPKTKRVRPVDTSPPVYAYLLAPIIPPPGTVFPPIEEFQQDGESTSSLRNVQQPEPIREGPTAFINALYISLILGSLEHSWWVLGVSLLIGLMLTGIVVLAGKSEIVQRRIATIVWLLFALIWGYIGWLICDAYMYLIIHILCAFIGFMLGFIGYSAIGTITSPPQSEKAHYIKPFQEVKRSGLTTFIDTICISLVFGLLLHSWWVLGASLLVGLVLTGIVVLSVRDNVYALNQTSVNIVWLCFALMWGYVGWFILDAHISSIIHFLCAFIGFILGLIGYPLTYAFISFRGRNE